MATEMNIDAAAQIVMDAECNALVAIKNALDTLDASLDAVVLSLPAVLTIDAARMANDIRGNFNYRRNQELPQLIARYTGQAQTPASPLYVPPAPPAPEGNTNG